MRHVTDLVIDVNIGLHLVIKDQNWREREQEENSIFVWRCCFTLDV